MQSDFGPSPRVQGKTITIPKPSSTWSPEEQQKLMTALQNFGRDWKQIENFVGTKNLVQVRTHAQKYFKKLRDNGFDPLQAIPALRNKRKEITCPDITVSWVTPLDVLQNRPQLANLEDFNGWMKENGFLPDYPPPGINVHALAEIQKQQREFLQESMSSILRALTIEKLSSKTPGADGPDWNKLYTYLSVLFETDAIGSDPSRTISLGAQERQILQLLMQNLLNNLSDQNFCDQQRIILEEFQEMQERVREESGSWRHLLEEEPGNRVEERQDESRRKRMRKTKIEEESDTTYQEQQNLMNQNLQ